LNKYGISNNVLRIARI